ncbi:MAG TPA: choice-of-anchor D domain-containing protein [Verrucomicrobiales bacterium]|jgi:hypothetical protein|nr:choice-of-anchor D domain-containing protein [Verrucomicrobiales bacterium]
MSPSQTFLSPAPGAVCKACPVLAILLLLLGAAFGQLQPEIDIQQPAGTSIPDNGTVQFGLVSVGSSVTKTFTIKNTGTGILSGLTLTKVGTHAADYTNTTLTAVSLISNASTTFSVTFSPSQSGGRTAILRVGSNDVNENPYDINLTGTGTMPEIAVTQSTNSMVSGSSTVNFGRVNVGSTSTRTFTIRNTGTGNLTDLSLTLTGGAFTATSLSTTTLGSGATTGFTVTFAPQATQDYSGTLRIFSNDANENPFQIALTGAGKVEWLELEQPEGVSLENGVSIVDFGTAGIGESVPLEFTVRNVGNGSLTFITTFLTGNNPDDFIVNNPGVEEVLPGATYKFSVNFSPTAAGERTAVLEVTSSETFGSGFFVTLRGTSALSDAGDADGDGTQNLVESAVGTDPAVGNPPPGVLTLNGDNLEYTYTRLKSALSEVTFSLDVGSSPEGPWSSIGENGITPIGEDETTQLVKYILPAESGRKFVRLRVTRL